MTSTTLTASKRIYLLAADETHVAVAYAATKNCIESWDVGAKKLVRFAEGRCESSPSGDDTSVFGLAVGGSRLAWAGGLYTLHDWQTVSTATRNKTRQTNVFGMEDEGFVQGPYGGGGLIVFSYSDYERTARGSLYRVEVKPGVTEDWCDTCAVRLVRDRAPLAVEAGRIAAQTPSGSVELLNAMGQTLRTFPAKLKKDGRAALQGNRLVVQQAKSAIVYDTDPGKRLASWPLGTGKLVDLQGDIAVYIAGRRIHLRGSSTRTTSIEANAAA